MASRDRKRLKRNDEITEGDEELSKCVRFNDPSKTTTVPTSSNFYGNIADTYFDKWSFNDKSNLNLNSQNLHSENKKRKF